MRPVASLLADARATLEAAGIPAADARLDAEVLARHLLNWDRATLIVRSREPAPDDFQAAFAALITRRAAREPVAHIVGHREFWGLDFEVTPDVLVPRPETELIVEEALAFNAERPLRRVIDVGTGSGCIAIAIATALPTVHVSATDTSAAALQVAARNARRHGVESRIEFLETDLLRGVCADADLIVSNPPYVPEPTAGELAPEVVDHEPHAALFGGPTGLDVIAKLVAEAKPRLAAGGRLVVEFGFGQAAGVARLAETEGWRSVRVREDLQAIPRVIVLTRSNHG